MRNALVIRDMNVFLFFIKKGFDGVLYPSPGKPQQNAGEETNDRPQANDFPGDNPERSGGSDLFVVCAIEGQQRGIKFAKGRRAGPGSGEMSGGAGQNILLVDGD